MKREMMEANKKQMAMKAERTAAAAREEAAARQVMLDKFAADDRLEQMNAQKRRMKALEHKREVCPRKGNGHRKGEMHEVHGGGRQTGVAGGRVS